MTDQEPVYAIQTEPVMRPREKVAFRLLSVFVVMAAATVSLRWFSSPQWHANFWLLLLFTVVLLPGLVKQFARWFLLPFMHRPLPLLAIRGARVAAVTTIVPRGESLSMLEDTLVRLLAMSGEHDVWVLDESDDPGVHYPCGRLGAHHFSPQRKPRYQAESGPLQAACKHGNNNSWVDVPADRQMTVLSDRDLRCSQQATLRLRLDAKVGSWSTEAGLGLAASRFRPRHGRRGLGRGRRGHLGRSRRAHARSRLRVGVGPGGPELDGCSAQVLSR